MRLQHHLLRCLYTGARRLSSTETGGSRYWKCLPERTQPIRSSSCAYLCLKSVSFFFRLEEFLSLDSWLGDLRVGWNDRSLDGNSNTSISKEGLIPSAAHKETTRTTARVLLVSSAKAQKTCTATNDYFKKDRTPPQSAEAEKKTLSSRQGPAASADEGSNLFSRRIHARWLFSPIQRVPSYSLSFSLLRSVQ